MSQVTVIGAGGNDSGQDFLPANSSNVGLIMASRASSKSTPSPQKATTKYPSDRYSRQVSTV